MSKFWCIKDTGKVGAKLGQYFTGWKPDPIKSWENDVKKALPFKNKEQAFKFLYKEMPETPIYAPEGSKIRFTIFRVNKNGKRYDCAESPNPRRTNGKVSVPHDK